MASSYVGGLSGAFIPVSEDQGMIDAVKAGALTLEKLEAMTCVCSVGLDMIAVSGDTKPSTIAGIIADEMAIGMINQKTTAVRLIPVIGKGVGEMVEFGGLLGYAPIMPVNQFSCEAFVSRTGRIPAPIHSLRIKERKTQCRYTGDGRRFPGYRYSDTEDKMKTYKHLVFDIDGTIIDSAKINMLPCRRRKGAARRRDAP